VQVFTVESKKAATFTVAFTPPEVGTYSHELQLRVKLNPFEQYRVVVTGEKRLGEHIPLAYNLAGCLHAANNLLWNVAHTAATICTGANTRSHNSHVAMILLPAAHRRVYSRRHHLCGPAQ
jgi:hypothetical protein